MARPGRRAGYGRAAIRHFTVAAADAGRRASLRPPWDLAWDRETEQAWSGPQPGCRVAGGDRLLAPEIARLSDAAEVRDPVPGQQFLLNGLRRKLDAAGIAWISRAEPDGSATPVADRRLDDKAYGAGEARTESNSRAWQPGAGDRR